MLPEDLQEDVKKGRFDKSIINYVHPKDTVGAGAFDAYEKHIGSTYYLGMTFDVENHEQPNPLVRLYNSITGDKKSQEEYFHGMQHYTFDKFGNLSASFLTNALTGNREWHSPRYASTDITTIEVVPNDLISLSKELIEIYQRVDSVFDGARNKINSLESIQKNSGVQAEALHAISEFQRWFGETTNDLSNTLNSSAEMYVQADKLP
ncbi:hypothetical protein ACQKKK_17120 [Peribacillus sp. NPDC006672]|uniref:hypothetical protein n=1 Tax=Peribacillus sp. NPDC006672 TaxID=3390606 RepID=UPI003D075BD8